MNSASNHFPPLWGIGMIVVVVLFAPTWGGGGYWGSVPSVAYCTAWYGNTSLQQLSKGCCSLRMCGPNIWADFQLSTLVSSLSSGANAAPASVQASMH